MNARTAKAVLAWVAVGTLAWLPLTSAGMTLLVFGEIPQEPHWWSILVAAIPYWGRPEVADWQTWIACAAACVAAFPAACVLRASYQPRLRPLQPGEVPQPPKRSSSAAYGTGGFLPIPELAALYPGPNGIPIGEAYDPRTDPVARAKRFNPRDPKTWGQGGKAPLLMCDDGDEVFAPHGVAISGSGGGKTSTVTIPALYACLGSTITFDPAGQAYEIARRHREMLGHKVHHMGDPTRKKGKNYKPSSGFNALDWIDICHPLAELHVMITADLVMGGLGLETKDENALFSQSGRAMAIAILADMLWDPKLTWEQRDLREFRRRVLVAEKTIQRDLEVIHESSHSQLARDFAGRLMEVTPKTFSGMYSNTTTATDWLSIKALADLVCCRDFDPVDLLNGDLDIFINLPGDVLHSFPGVSRTILGGLINAVFQAGERPESRILLLLDEAKFLGAMPLIERILIEGRKWGLTMITMWPDIAAMKGVWKDGFSSFFGSAAWKSFAAIGDLETAEYVSKMCSTHGVQIHSESLSRASKGSNKEGGTTRGLTTSERQVNVIDPGQVLALSPAVQVLLPRSSPPACCGRVYYYRRPEMAKAMQPDSFVKPLPIEENQPWLNWSKVRDRIPAALRLRTG